MSTAIPSGFEVVDLAGGCFWCVEAPFAELRGVQSAVSGYMGGHVKDPSYRDVCSGTTGHAEVVRVVFDPAVLPFPSLLDVFFDVHDPTTLNRQGNDVGTQYRSAIFYHMPDQLVAAKTKIKALESSGAVRSAVVTELSRASEHTFYAAEEYHQCYVKTNPDQGYVRSVSLPKLFKVREKYKHLLK